MIAESRAQIGLIRSDLARLENLLPPQIIQKVLSHTAGTASKDTLAAYREIRVFSHTQGWLFKALCRFLMPFRLVSRGIFTKRVTMSFPAMLYALLLGIVWMFLVSDRGVLLLACVLTWVLVAVKAFAPKISAFYYLNKNKEIYRYIRHLEEVGIYGLE